jgi:hypothetical protein
MKVQTVSKSTDSSVEACSFKLFMNYFFSWLGKLLLHMQFIFERIKFLMNWLFLTHVLLLIASYTSLIINESVFNNHQSRYTIIRTKIDLFLNHISVKTYDIYGLIKDRQGFLTICRQRMFSISGKVTHFVKSLHHFPYKRWTKNRHFQAYMSEWTTSKCM